MEIMSQWNNNFQDVPKMLEDASIVFWFSKEKYMCREANKRSQNRKNFLLNHQLKG